MTDSFEPSVMQAGKELAERVALSVADRREQVGEYVGANTSEDGLTEFLFNSDITGYENWKWSVSLFYDKELQNWTVCESSLIPSKGALLAPEWVSWKDRLLPSDLSPSDVLGTDPDDERLENGVMHQEEKPADEKQTENKIEDQSETADSNESSAESDENSTEDSAEKSAADSAGDSAENKTENKSENISEYEQLAEELELSHRRVLSQKGKSEACQRWYSGQPGPKSVSTAAANGKTCQTCGFFIPIKGELNLMFGVCANKWSADDGRVVSRDHGCGEHSEILPPDPTPLWIQTQPVEDDDHIEIVMNKTRRDEIKEVELLEETDSLVEIDMHAVKLNAQEDEDGDSIVTVAGENLIERESIDVSENFVTEDGAPDFEESEFKDLQSETDEPETEEAAEWQNGEAYMRLQALFAAHDVLRDEDSQQENSQQEE